MLQLSQNPGRQLTDMNPSTSWSRQDPSATAHHPAGSLDQASPAFRGILTSQSAVAGTSSVAVGSQASQQAAGSSRHGTMEEWADIFDQCKTAVNGTDKGQGGQHPDPRSFASFMSRPTGSYVTPENGAFETVKSLNSEEDCMFGDSDDEGVQSSGNAPQRLPFFGGIADWPVKQMPHLPVSLPALMHSNDVSLHSPYPACMCIQSHHFWQHHLLVLSGDVTLSLLR